MKGRKRDAVRLGLACLLLAVVAVAAVELTPGVPNIFNPNETDFQQQTHFLTLGKIGENATTATAYYNAIDPSQSKRNFTQWLVNAGFIQNESQWHSTGQQLIACDLPGCDLPSRDSNGNLTYGDNIINTDSHAIVLNAADLGFVRNQFIRCKPSCSAPNPIIYSYLENYPVNPFAASGNGGSGFPTKTGYPTQAEATAAIQSALKRPLGDLPGCDAAKTDTALKCSIQRIADVAFEWGPPPTNPTSKSRYGQLYAFIFNGDGTETIALPATSGIVGQTTPNIATKTLNTINAGDPFPPNLDFLGFKQHPGVCVACHGGSPQALTSTGAYPNQGKVSGFRFLPLDIASLLFTSDLGPEATSRVSQEPQLKAYNLAVLKTVPSGAKFDGQVTRVAHLREAIVGWYAAFPGDQTMSGATQKHEFIPQGWLEPTHGGTAPDGSEELYLQTVGPSCRSCHFNRELSEDFGTAANFRSFEEDILELVLKPLCRSNSPRPGKRPMPLAHLTFQRFWQANNNPVTLPSGQPPITLHNTAELLAQYFGYSGTADYCSSLQ